MATIDIGKISFTQKGTWSSATAYTTKDVVQYLDNGEFSSYVAIAASTNQAPATNGTVNTSYWNLMARGNAVSSTNQGTWSSSTAYNKNDIVQYASDGTHTFLAVQGSTNQAPQTTGVVNTTYWTKLASGVAGSGNVDVLASVDASSSASLSVDGFFNDAIYGHYKIVFQNIVFSTTTYVNMRALDASGEVSSTVYAGVKHVFADFFDTAGFYLTRQENAPLVGYTSGYDNYIQIGRSERTSRGKFQYRTTPTGHNMNGTIELPSAGHTNNISGSYDISYRGGDTANGNTRLAGTHEDCHFQINTTTAVTGWKLYPSTGTITSGRMTLYGFKK